MTKIALKNIPPGSQDLFKSSSYRVYLGHIFWRLLRFKLCTCSKAGGCKWFTGLRNKCSRGSWSSTGFIRKCCRWWSTGFRGKRGFELVHRCSLQTCCHNKTHKKQDKTITACAKPVNIYTIDDKDVRDYQLVETVREKVC